MIAKIHLNDDAKKRESSGMGQATLQRRKDVLRLFSRHAQVKRVGAKIKLTRPLDGTIRCDGDLLKQAGLFPSHEDTFPNQGRKIDYSELTVVKMEFKSETR
jgi:hypothetical protein